MITVNTWGSGGIGTIRVRVSEPYTTSEAAARSIQRRTGLHLATWRSDGTALERGEPVANHYTGTLARPCPGGGWTPVSEIWASIPVRQGGP